jgi:hypothetical protein
MLSYLYRNFSLNVYDTNVRDYACRMVTGIGGSKSVAKLKDNRQISPNVPK